MQYVVRFARMPTSCSAKEALIVEADDPVKAVMVMRDHLLRRGDDPDGFVPSVGYHLRELQELCRNGVNSEAVKTLLRLHPTADPKERLRWKILYHAEAMAEEAGKYVEPYVPAPGRVFGSL